MTTVMNNRGNRNNRETSESKRHKAIDNSKTNRQGEGLESNEIPADNKSKQLTIPALTERIDGKARATSMDRSDEGRYLGGKSKKLKERARTDSALW